MNRFLTWSLLAAACGWLLVPGAGAFGAMMCLWICCVVALGAWAAWFGTYEYARFVREAQEALKDGAA